MLQVVEDEQDIRDHETAVIDIKILRKECGNPFKGPHHIVIEITYRSTGKSREGIVQDRFVPCKKVFESSERVFGFASLNYLSIFQDFAGLVFTPE
jgi:hypothetical protein